MENIYDVVIVGAGPAGMTAAIYAIRANMRVLMLDRLSPGGQMINTNEIENYTGAGKLSGAELAIKMFEHTQELGVEFDYKTVIDISNGGPLKTLTCEEDNTVYQARAVILATGTVPRRLGVPGEDQWAGSGISWCAICDGAQYRDKEVVVIGGGNSAVEESIYLAGICTKLTIVTMFDLTADPKACDQLRRMANVTIYPYQEVLEFTGEDRLTGVRFKSTKEDATERYVSCDGVFEYIGFQASSQAFAKLGIVDRTGCIETDARMRTKVPGIFGAGDITVKHLRQIVTACSDGAVAANSAASYVESLKQ
ncbi:FAD-dependent pyridine nucleotide-disulfide oxidoreductase [Desulfobulbus propionicus DSM 2032]|jgi:thioredoxin reductase (NADPH)|uniref:FAD-dependent pyridine nucleotide-disulfide oxidoreductase n=1 Tax=Desulfobulbus propionicus (strain ATCC 33891 / DSM 2032 / VKM B-1956 / 1pr3) TaxID=577650 RepID=A0A7U3YLV4_DESPD|nr:FAD-dependent oxidoreductase [Desulfobulbus propionicus]ADW17792.1 FAD-dependent pyridine nucleotide-disulfide oxidoreductase [Desulfobulbus propionicus DSM 2032]